MLHFDVDTNADVKCEQHISLSGISTPYSSCTMAYYCAFQAVPIPADKAEEVQETMMGCALSQNFELHEIPTHSDITQVGCTLNFLNIQYAIYERVLKNSENWNFEIL